MKRSTSLLDRIVFAVIFTTFCSVLASAQSNYVLKTGDTMTGILNIESQGNEYNFVPNIQLSGSSSQYKFLEMKNTTTDAAWDLTMDTYTDQLIFYYSPEGSTWTTPFSIDNNGIIFGNGFGLTNLNIALGIPDGVISLDKLETEVVTTGSLTDGSIESLVVDNGITITGGFVSGIPSTTPIGGNAHAEGLATVATGIFSHAEGIFTEAGGPGSHVEGFNSKTFGRYSHAGGLFAHANHDDTYVWSSSDNMGSTVFSSTTNKQFSVYAHNGIRLVPGEDAVVKVEGRLEAESIDLSNIGVYGDISMGSFTNTPASN